MARMAVVGMSNAGCERAPALNSELTGAGVDEGPDCGEGLVVLEGGVGLVVG